MVYPVYDLPELPNRCCSEVFRVKNVLKYKLVFVCVSVCVCVFSSSKKTDSLKRGRNLYHWVFILTLFACSLPQDWIFIAWLSRTRLYVFCYMNHYKQQLWEGNLGPVIILMKQKDCIPSEVNFSRSQIKLLSANSEHAGNRTKITGASDWLCGLVALGVVTESLTGHPGNPMLL